MSDITPGDRFLPREDLVLEEIDDEVIILDLRNNAYFGLDPIARRVWQGLSDALSVAEIVDAIAADFDVAHDQIAADVSAFIDEALSAGLVSAR